MCFLTCQLYTERCALEVYMGVFLFYRIWSNDRMRCLHPKRIFAGELRSIITVLYILMLVMQTSWGKYIVLERLHGLLKTLGHRCCVDMDQIHREIHSHSRHRQNHFQTIQLLVQGTSGCCSGTYHRNYLYQHDDSIVDRPWTM